MNNLIRLKKMAVFSLVLCFLLLNSVEMTGQSLKLTKDLDDGSELEWECIKQSSGLRFFIRNTSHRTIHITNINVISNPQNALSNINVSEVYILAGDHIEVVSTHTSLWSMGTQINGTIYFDYEIMGSAEPIIVSYSGTLEYLTCGSLPHETPITRQAVSLVEKPIQISPNPVKKTFQIKYSLEENSNIDIALYNNLGKKVKTIVNSETQSAGQYTVEESLSSDLPNGIYYVISNIGGEISSEKLVKL